MQIELPHRWRPRPYQREAWRYLEQGGKRLVIVWPRRSGKDTVSLHWTATQVMERPGNYWHLFPELKQARRAIWEGVNARGPILEQVFPQEIVESRREDEMLLRFVSGSTWQLMGADRYDSAVGANPVGCVFSEYSIMDPRAWDFVRPILAENGGWAIFPYTPRGRNHGATLYDAAKANPGWHAELLTADQTRHIPADVLERERREMDPELFQQEYFCSFNAGISGSYFARELDRAEAEGRIGPWPAEPSLPVYTAWDLGIADSTVIWFAQAVGGQVRIVDYYEAHNEPFDHYLRVIKSKPYVYAEHYGPHDIVQRDHSGKSRMEVAAAMGVFFTVAPRLSVTDGIEASRRLIRKCWFNLPAVGRGLDCLRNYRREYSDKLKLWAGKPVHDWSSHGADAFRYLAVSLHETVQQPAKLRVIRALN